MDFAAQVDERLHNLAKPPGSLGLLEQQVRQVFLAWGSFQEELRPRHIIFAADNGVVRSGVVAQLSDITYMQSVHMTEGTSAVTCFCRCHGIPYEVVDVGIDSEDAVGVDRKIARGTADFSVQPAMTTEQFTRAAAVGRERVEAAKARGCNILSFGEMGIGNTTTSAAVLTAIAPAGSAFLVGHGSSRGNYRLWFHKEQVVKEALQKYKEEIQSPEDALRCVGGFDLAALYGAMLACAVKTRPNVRQYALPSHISREPGMSAALRLCGIDEYDVPIHADMALGEGTGAVLGVVMLKTMLYAVGHMATLDGINGEAEERHRRRMEKGAEHQDDR